MTPDTASSATTASPLPHLSGSAFIASDSSRKRSLESSENQENKRKARKATRACDRCKSRKAKCSGLNPCETCLKRGEQCTWNSSYSRGVARTPLPSSHDHVPKSSGNSFVNAEQRNHTQTSSPHPQLGIASSAHIAQSRDSPEVESARIRGQYHDSTSGLAFVHRAYRRLSMRQNHNIAHASSGSEKQQPLISAGDWPPMDVPADCSISTLPVQHEALDVLQFYFEHCVVTYRLLHRPSVEAWLRTLLDNKHRAAHQVVGYARASIIYTIFAIVAYRKEQMKAIDAIDGQRNFVRSDLLFHDSKTLTDGETGLPRLESAQARLLQVLYLLQTARMNQAWYVFGNALQIISALGLHRKPHSIWDETPKTPGGLDYINLQCRKRTFWMAYTLDKYLCIVLGRPTHYHDNDIDQEFPDRVDDEDMQADGPTAAVGMEDCFVDGLIAHAKLARILGGISSEVYRIHQQSKDEVVTAAKNFNSKLEEWHTELPVHLGRIRPSSLVPELRRQAVALKLGFAHARMHLNRPFILGSMSHHQSHENIVECLSAARDALQIVNTMAADGTLVYSLWWMYYVAFCALSVVYIWEIQCQTQPGRTSSNSGVIDMKVLLGLANQCHEHLAQKAPINSPSRAYGIVLEELRKEAKQHTAHPNAGPLQSHVARTAVIADDGAQVFLQSLPSTAESILIDSTINNSDAADTSLAVLPSIWDEWSTTDWIDFDSSAYLPFYGMDSTEMGYSDAMDHCA